MTLPIKNSSWTRPRNVWIIKTGRLPLRYSDALLFRTRRQFLCMYAIDLCLRDGSGKTYQLFQKLPNSLQYYAFDKDVPSLNVLVVYHKQDSDQNNLRLAIEYHRNLYYLPILAHSTESISINIDHHWVEPPKKKKQPKQIDLLYFSV